MNYITKCADGWCGQLNNIIQYIVEPDPLISLASTNKAMLVYVQRFFQRIQKDVLNGISSLFMEGVVMGVQNTPKNRPSESQQNQGVKSSDLGVQKGNVL